VFVTFLLYKMLYCYEKEIKRKSRYWQVIKVSNEPLDAWDRVIDSELERLEPIGSSLKQSLLKVAPTIKLKIEIETVYPDLTTVLEYTEALPNNDVLKLEIANAILIYKHVHNVLERSEVNFDRVVMENETTNVEQAVDRKI